MLVSCNSALALAQRRDTPFHVVPSEQRTVPTLELGVDSTRDDARTLWSRRELRVLSLFALGAIAVLPFDGRITHGLQAPRFQKHNGLDRSASIVRTLGDPGSLLMSASVYAIGRVGRHAGFADAGWHAGEAVVATGLVTLAIKGVVGRTRPYAAGGSDADEFRVFRGFQSPNASFPSGHTGVAFGAASAFSSELTRSHPRAAHWVSPILYTAAAGVGVSRLYNNQHWASDAIVAAALGNFIGRAVVRWSHD